MTLATEAYHPSSDARRWRRGVSRSMGTTNRVVCEACDGRGVVPTGPAWEAVLASLKQHFAGNPRVDVALDQSHCTPESNLRRVALMYEQGALAGKHILVLGDDDSVSA